MWKRFSNILAQNIQLILLRYLFLVNWAIQILLILVVLLKDGLIFLLDIFVNIIFLERMLDHGLKLLTI